MNEIALPVKVTRDVAIRISGHYAALAELTESYENSRSDRQTQEQIEMYRKLGEEVRNKYL